MSLALSKLRRKMAASSNRKLAVPSQPVSQPVSQPTKIAVAVDTVVKSTTKSATKSKNEVTFDDLNIDQKLAVSIAREGKSFCLIGAAGSGKTTATRSITQELYASGLIGKLTEGTDKLLRKDAPAVAVLSYTNQAVRNIRTALPEEFQIHCSTMHNLLEYHPEEIEVEVMEDGVWNGEYASSQRFVPRYGVEGSEAALSASERGSVWKVQQGNGLGDGMVLPHLDVIILEEAGSIPRELFYTLLSALPHPERTTFIFLGDLNQNPPVFDDAILGFALLQYPVIELKTLYRNVGLVTKLAHRILDGKPIRDSEAKDKLAGSDESGTVSFRPFKQHVDHDIATPSLGKLLKSMVLDGSFTEDDSVVLVPFNIKLGQEALNKWIAQGISERDNKDVHEVLGFGNHWYFSVGDKVLYNKRYHIISDIEHNESFTGKKPLPPSPHVSRWGNIARGMEEEVLGSNISINEYRNEMDIDDFLNSTASDSNDDAPKAASAKIHLHLAPEELTPDQQELMATSKVTFGKTTASSVSDISNMLMCYAMTIYKSQGSEWKNVYLILHRSHGKMLNREQLYTGVTRARRNLTMFYSGEDPREAGASALSRGILNQQIKGKGLESKLNYFRNKVEVENIKNELAAKRAANKVG